MSYPKETHYRMANRLSRMATSQGQSQVGHQTLKAAKADGSEHGCSGCLWKPASNHCPCDCPHTDRLPGEAPNCKLGLALQDAEVSSLAHLTGLRRGSRNPEGVSVSLGSLAEGGSDTSSQASLTHSQGRRPLPDLRCLGFRMAHLIGVMRGRPGPECAPVNLRDLAQGGSAG